MLLRYGERTKALCTTPMETHRWLRVGMTFAAFARLKSFHPSLSQSLYETPDSCI